MGKSYRLPFSPIDPDFTEIMEHHIEDEKAGKIHFFDMHGQVDSSEGTSQNT